MKKTIVIGGAGYIGSYIVEQMYAVDDHPTIVDPLWFGPDRDNKKFPWESVIPQVIQADYSIVDSFDNIIWLAGSSSVPICNASPTRAIEQGPVVLKHILNRMTDKQKLIYASSSCVYGEGFNKKEIDKCNVHDTLGCSKLAMDLIAQEYIDKKGFKVYPLRFGSVNGWSQNFRRDLCVNAMTYDVIKTNKVTVTNGACLRPITTLATINEVIETIINKDINPGIINVSDFNMTFEEMGKYILNIIAGGESHNWAIDISYGKETYNFSMYNQKMLNILGRASDDPLKSLTNLVLDIADGISKNPQFNYVPRASE